ncbi:hypothetical protein O6H91_16G013200 [Diphasiastrum complanatum]|uniref:Uncharacterized protein n=1 Tax=Diphasiastrum complanatum TaxID=34168 RepID=A0ACC2B9Z7_DIPCM|nr:hypothetical protein O6H91_16G013200 [Diphasiastrum complanatum]
MRQLGVSQWCWGVLVLVMLLLSPLVESHLQYNYYLTTCPAAEIIVRKFVKQALIQNPGLGAGLLRMHFHDCFVHGCDASVLIDSTPENQAEKDSFFNNPSLRGFEVIDKAKAQLEALCPGVVSCADILALAARDSVALLGGPFWSIRSGRRDGSVSNAADVLENLPTPFFDLRQLTQNFAAKGFSQVEMLTLAGAHTIGASHCTSFSNRIYNFSDTTPQDPTLNSHFAEELKLQCPQTDFDPDLRVGMDSFTPIRFDNKYYIGLRNGRGLFTSDQTLFTDDHNTAATVKQYSDNGFLFSSKFVSAMIKMSEIEVKTGLQGDVRKNCRAFN